MKTYEILSLILSFASVLCIAVGLIYTVRSLKLLRKTHADNHDWNRRYSTQVQLSRFFVDEIGCEMLNSEFQYMERTEQIPVDEIEKKFEQTQGLRIAFYKLLSFYESLARGIFQGIYDEEVVKESQQGEMIRIYEIFQNMIEVRRNEVNPITYGNFERIVNRWRKEKTPSIFRGNTGE